MRISDSTTEVLLKKYDKIPEEVLDSLREEEKQTGKALQELAIKRELIKEDTLTQLYAQLIDVPYVVVDPKTLTKEMVLRLPERIARQYGAVVFSVDDDGTHHIAMSDPDDVQAIDFIKKYTGNKTKLYVATDENIALALQAYREGAVAELSQAIEIQSERDDLDENISEDDIAEDSPVAQTVNLLLEYAIRSSASDIHIEPRDEYVSVRYRIDGVLREANKLPKRIHGALISRIKILSNLKIDERRVPQDGRFKITLSTHRYAFRVSTLPIMGGEKIVMRILNESSKAPTLEDLGYWGTAKQRINDAILQPHGMVLVTGPTGSGKSTSLFSILSILNNPSVNISTVEDPVEYKITGANQTQVNPVAGMTFATGLRALLRQDPNIIMVGEIRDGETANLGVQAALTGHLVFSTLHTNNAATCLPRLLDMGIEPFLIASTVRAVVGQRLVRTLCTVCREKYSPDTKQLEEISRLFSIGSSSSISWKQLHSLEKEASTTLLPDSDSKDTDALSTDDSGIKHLWRPGTKGCDTCGGTGYKGRIGIYEVLSNSSDIQSLIIGNATSDAIQSQAVKEKMITMQTDGLIKSLRGLTSIEEVLRVTRE